MLEPVSVEASARRENDKHVGLTLDARRSETPTNLLAELTGVVDCPTFAAP
jgi:hypothetical protein